MPRRFFLILILVFFTSACGVPAAPIPGSSAPTAPPPPPSILPNLVVQVDGQLQVRREGSTVFVPIGLGAQVQPGDTLRVLEGAAAVFCGNETLWDQSPRDLDPGEGGVPCLAGRPPRPMEDMTALRGDEAGVSGPIPYVLSPRSGWVLEDRPILRWRPVEGASAHTVTLDSDDGQERAPIVVSGNKLPYPETWPPLQAGGAGYRLIVETNGLANDHRSDEDETGNQGFSLLDPALAEALRARAARLRQRPLDGPALALLLARLYLNNDLRSEAVEILLAIPGGDQCAAVQRLLGETYLAMGLFAEAEPAFQRTLTLAQAAEFLEEQAAARLGLGWTACTLGDVDNARAAWEAALALYQEMEMEAKAGEVDTLLEAVDGQCIISP